MFIEFGNEIINTNMIKRVISFKSTGGFWEIVIYFSENDFIEETFGNHDLDECKKRYEELRVILGVKGEIE